MSTNSNGSGLKLAAEKVIGKRSVSEISQESENDSTVSHCGTSTKSVDNLSNSTTAQRPSRIIIIRHAERIDRVLLNWLEQSYDGGEYFPIDGNQPVKLPLRDPKHFQNDAPLTEMGNVTSKMLGRGLSLTEADIKTIFTSPSLRSVQTANGIIKNYNQATLNMNIEPGLFELFQWYPSPPEWMKPEELAADGYFVNEDYVPVISTTDLVRKYKTENVKEHYDRLHHVIKELLNKCHEGGTVLIVGHGTTIDAIPRKLMDMRDATKGEVDQLEIKYPYCSVVALEQQQQPISPDMKDCCIKWKLVESRMPQITYLDFKNNCDIEFLKRM